MLILMQTQIMQKVPEETLGQLSQIEKNNVKVMQALKESAASSEPVWRTNTKKS